MEKIAYEDKKIFLNKKMSVQQFENEYYENVNNFIDEILKMYPEEVVKLLETIFDETVTRKINKILGIVFLIIQLIKIKLILYCQKILIKRKLWFNFLAMSLIIFLC